jgi:hypothetical protein
MQTNVSGLLRHFPQMKRAALRGDRVTIKTREGNLILMAESGPQTSVIGAMKGMFRIVESVDITRPTSEVNEWKPSC